MLLHKSNTIKGFATKFDHHDQFQTEFVHDAISYTAILHPNRTAIFYEGLTLSYSQLEILSNQFAHYLIRLGIKSESKIGVCIEPGIELVVAILGILKAGAAYVPLMPTLPVHRINTILEDSEATLIITGNDYAEQTFITQKLSFNLNNWKQEPGDNTKPVIICSANHAAYVLYTSGSTGKPKGVVIEHRNLTYYLNWTINILLPEVGVKLPLTSSMSFAAGITQLYSSLLLGNTLHILPSGLIKQPEQLMKWYSNNEDYGFYCVPTLWNEILNWAEQQIDKNFETPKSLLLSGEAIPEVLLDRTFKLFPQIRIWNLYGPTEAVANLSATELFPGQKIGIGNALPGTLFFIVKEDGTKALVGETGELIASGAGLARGYLGKQELTDAAFIIYTSKKHGPLRAYRTGDLVKTDENGSIIYQGRLDQQVKIRGFRIELMEVELALKKVFGVKQAVVKKHQINNSELFLLAYVSAEQDKQLSIPYLRQELSKLLPDYMIPERWIFIDNFPTLANGKINRNLLPEPENPRPQLGYEPVYAVRPKEIQLVNIFEKILGFNGLGLTDNFFDLGGTSLKINAILNEVKKTFSSNIPYRSIFDYPTPSSLLVLIEESKINILDETNITNELLLAPNQTGLWFEEQLNPGGTAYNIPYSIKIKGTLNVIYVQKALQAIVNKHSPLRSHFVVHKGVPQLCIKENLTISLPVTDLGFMNEEDALKNAYKLLEDAALKPFDLSSAPLFRFQLYRLGDKDYLLSLIIHHIVFDGWSINVFYDDFNRYYDDFSNNIIPEIIALGTSYLDFAGSYREKIKTEEYHKTQQFWQQKLAVSSGQTMFPTDFSNIGIKNTSGERISFTLSANFKEQVLQLNKQQSTTPFICLLSAFVVLLQRYTGEEDLLIATPVANRLDTNYYPLIGYFTNTLMLRLKTEKEDSFVQLLRNVKETCIETFSYSNIPFDKQLKILRDQSMSGQTANVHIMFAYHEAFNKKPLTTNLNTEINEHFNHAAKLPIFMECQDAEDGIRITLTYDKALYHEQTMVKLMNHYTTLLSEIIKDTSKKANQYDIQTQFEKSVIQAQYKANYKRYPGTHLLHKLFEETAALYAEQIAIRYNEQSFTYKQLDLFANELAWKLINEGFTPGDSAGIFMEHSPGMIAAMLAVMKCGGYYVPLDPGYPEKRTDYVIEHAALKVIITDDLSEKKLAPNQAKHIKIKALIDDEIKNHQVLPDIAVDENALIYTIYTSGSTGKPKGVMLPHKGVCNYLLWMKDKFEIGTKDKILAKTSISFDISVWELFLPLISGGTVILADSNLLKAPEQIAALVISEKINILQFVPSGLKTFADAGVLSGCTSLIKIFSGGEQLPVSLQDSVLNQFKGELHNLYGPTEASIFMSHWQCRRNQHHRTVPIGSAIPNSSLYVLNSHLQAQPTGIPGEIYIGGEILAKGYLANEQQTNAAFIPSPFDEDKLIYKTGDLGRFLQDGTLEFLGRVDHQVKVRGYRIELGEIEETLLNIPGIVKAVVYRKEFSKDDVRLLAYLITKQGSSLKENEIRTYLKTYLPEYMIPSAYHFVPEIPLLPNGKTDLKSLAEIRPVPQMIKEEILNSHNQKDDIERILRNIWEEVLGHNDFRVTDNFMDAGGHSILLIRVCELINERLNENYTLIDMFQYTNIQAFAKQYREKYTNSVQNEILDRITKRKMNINNIKKRFNRN